MATLSSFEPFVMPDVQGCPAAVVRNAITFALIDFCRRSRYWQEDCAAGSTADGKTAFAITLADGADIVSIVDVKVGGYPIVRDGYSLSGSTLKTTYPLSPGYPVVVSAQLAPKASASSFPDSLLQYTEGIASGAKFRLMIQPGKAWSTPDLAAVHRSLFEQAIADAMVRVESQGVIGATYAAPVRFGF